MMKKSQMRSFKSKYSIRNGIISLKSTKLDKRYLSKFNLIIGLIENILEIRMFTGRRKYRINYILTEYSIYKKTKNRTILNKNIEKFTYSYRQYYTNSLTGFLYKKGLYVMKCILLTYMYLVYKLLSSRNPVFIYYHFIQHS